MLAVTKPSTAKPKASTCGAVSSILLHAFNFDNMLAIIYN